MPALTFEEKKAQKTLYELGYQYLTENFHKFKETNKIKVSLEVLHIFNKDGSKSLQTQNILTLVFNNGDEDVKKRLEQMTGKSQFEIPAQT